MWCRYRYGGIGNKIKTNREKRLRRKSINRFTLLPFRTKIWNGSAVGCRVRLSWRMNWVNIFDFLLEWSSRITDFASSIGWLNGMCEMRTAYVASYFDTKLIATAAENLPAPHVNGGTNVYDEKHRVDGGASWKNCWDHQMQEINRKKMR